MTSSRRANTTTPHGHARPRTSRMQPTLKQFGFKSWSTHRLAQRRHRLRLGKAKNGTAYLTTCFTVTWRGYHRTDFVYAITDYNNKPVPYDKVDARAFTDGTSVR